MSREECELCGFPLGDGWCSNCATVSDNEEVGLVADRRYRIGASSGDTFAVDDNFDGTTLTVEVPSMDDGRRLVALIARAPDMAAALIEAEKALERIAISNCGCKPHCRCREEGALIIWKEEAQDEAAAALATIRKVTA